VLVFGDGFYIRTTSLLKADAATAMLPNAAPAGPSGGARGGRLEVHRLVGIRRTQLDVQERQGPVLK
jgi:hypothetical protein